VRAASKADATASRAGRTARCGLSKRRGNASSAFSTQRKSEPGLYAAQQAVLEQARLAAEKLLQRVSPPQDEQL
jgi:hypothetical protein